jgi:GTPase SAR1 family protein
MEQPFSLLGRDRMERTEVNSIPSKMQTTLPQSDDSQPLIGLIGLPSAGKSTMINALIGKRIQQTGVCRTTRDVHLIGPCNLFSLSADHFHKEQPISDDGIKYSIIDLPGMSDAENSGVERNFDEITHAWITNCDLVLWVSDINSAFLTSHEKTEFDHIRSILDQRSLETGDCYQIGIMLSKFNQQENQFQSTPSAKVNYLAGEIVDDYEETTVTHCLERVHRLFPAGSVPILKFNAFGRITHHPSSSPALKRLVSNMGGAHDCHTEFNLGPLFKDHNKVSDQQLIRSFFLYDLPRAHSAMNGIQRQIGPQKPDVDIINKSIENKLSRIKEASSLATLFNILIGITKISLPNMPLFNQQSLVNKAYGEEVINYVCQQVGINMGRRMDKEVDWPNWNQSSKIKMYRAMLMWGINSRKGPQIFFSLPEDFTTILLDQSVSWSCLPMEHPNRPACTEMDRECLILKNAISSKWQQSLRSKITEVWQLSAEKSGDLEISTIIALYLSKKIRSLFQSDLYV